MKRESDKEIKTLEFVSLLHFALPLASIDSLTCEICFSSCSVKLSTPPPTRKVAIDKSPLDRLLLIETPSLTPTMHPFPQEGHRQ